MSTGQLTNEAGPLRVTGQGPRLGRFGASALACLGACLAAAAAVITAGSGHTWLEAITRSVIVAAPIAVGIYAWRRSPFERFGVLMVASGVVLFVTTLAESTHPVPYTIGRMA